MEGQSYLYNFLGLILHYLVYQIKGKGKGEVAEGAEGGGGKKKKRGEWEISSAQSQKRLGLMD